MRIIFTCGISCSGKSTWATEHADAEMRTGKNVAIISRDQFRHEILFERKAKGYTPYSDSATHSNIWNVWKFGKDEKVVNERWEAALEAVLSQGVDVVILADTNLNRARLEAKMDALRADPRTAGHVWTKEFPITFEEALKRDNARPDGVGHTVLWRQYLQWREYIGEKKYVADLTKPKAIVFDVDGTLAKMGDRGAFDWHKVEVDLVREEIRDMFLGYQQLNYIMIIVSGRDAVCRNETSRWLIENNILYNSIFMRPENDMRDDRLIKEEIFLKNIEPNYNVIAWVDDRPKVCRKMRELGLNVIQVADPLLEF